MKRTDKREAGALLHGTVSEVWAQEGYGRIQAKDGQEFLFRRSDVHGDGFARMVVGTQASFHLREHEDGQDSTASDVRVTE